MIDWDFENDGTVVFYFNGKEVARCDDEDFDRTYERVLSKYGHRNF
jgi:hypothetical protein